MKLVQELSSLMCVEQSKVYVPANGQTQENSNASVKLLNKIKGVRSRCSPVDEQIEDSRAELRGQDSLAKSKGSGVVVRPLTSRSQSPDPSDLPSDGASILRATVRPRAEYSTTSAREEKSLGLMRLSASDHVDFSSVGSASLFVGRERDEAGFGRGL